MHQRLAEVVQYAEEARVELLASVSSVPSEELGRRPGAEAWSAAEVLDHLALSEGGIVRFLGKRLARAKEEGLPSETSEESVLGSLDRFGLEDPSVPMSAPEVVRPRGDADAGRALESLRASRVELLRLAAEGDGLDLTRVKGQHALFGELNFYEWILMIGQHERRHVTQLSRIGELLGRR